MEAEQPERSEATESMKLAIAVALLQSKRLQNQQPPQPDALKWKRKAKERKQEILKLHDDLKLAQDGLQYDLFPQSASCKCYFFDNLGTLSTKTFGNGSDARFNDVLRRRFLKQVRINEQRRKRTGSRSQQLGTLDYNSESEKEQLRSSIDFLVELCETVTPRNVELGNFKNLSHQSVEFILATLKNLSTMEKNREAFEDLISSLITRLLRRMCTSSTGDGLIHIDTDAQFYVQHVVRKLGAEAYIGQRVIVAVSQKISMVAESLLFMDPFDEAFPSMHSCMYIMIQLIEFLVSDYLSTWSTSEDFDSRFFEEGLVSILEARRGLELLESRNGVYEVYIDRVIGIVAKQVGQFSCFNNINPEILAKLFN